jgi:Lrp/AsnC family transcriptional regulator, regulator for asnA, asnC and gidA
MKNSMDQLDLDIIAHLQRDGRKPFTAIAANLGVSEGTIRNRVSRLMTEQILQVIGMADPLRLGFDAPAMIGVSVQPSMLKSAMEAIAEFSEVSYLIMVSGEFDLFVEVMCRDRKHLATFLRDHLHQVTGIVRTQTFLILHTHKMAYGALPSPLAPEIDETMAKEVELEP